MPEDFTLESLAQAVESQMSDEPETEEDQPAGESEAEEGGGEAQEQEATENEGAESEESEEGEGDQPEEESPQDRVVKWKTADGTEYEVPESELQKGYMREQDYRQKTQGLAREREQAESEIQTRAQQQVAALNLYGEKIGELHMARAAVAHLESALKQINREDDPSRYALVQSDLSTARQTAQDLTERLGKATQLMQSQEAERIAKGQQEAARVLSAEMPDFPNRLKAWNKHATETYGFNPEELSRVTDPRVFRMLDDAVKYRDLQNRKPEAVKKAAAAPQKPAKQTRSTPPSTIETVKKRFNAKPTVDGLAQMLMATGKV
ncbi:hypothetical protein CAL26_23735 [Bordetella genomosp. 9]|uniref:Scaffolding protein n=1 Tax=Bordetella genomosp. 9 TaxID=1416803 RepID=A0A261R662_9BORD|nr:hypothetical protein [Bordetella genomosp. 9]OZI20509.1 hypothetical protein CAL26_23735 [Bordetella genomosp. 9]